MKFKVGDKVRVKEWKDVLKVCGIDKDHSSGAVYIIAKVVADVCGLVFTVTECQIRGCYSISGLDRFGHEIKTVLVEELLEPVCDARILITTDGKVTLARLYEDGEVKKSAKAECSPDDTFDFSLGAKLAFERLTKTNDPKYIKGAKYMVIGNSYPLHYFPIGTIVTATDTSATNAGSGWFRSGHISQIVNLCDVKLVGKPSRR